MLFGFYFLRAKPSLTLPLDCWLGEGELLLYFTCWLFMIRF
jgi:hypothetical protein